METNEEIKDKSYLDKINTKSYFKEQKTLIDYNNLGNKEERYISHFEVYNLKSIKESFFIAFSFASPYAKGLLKIYKYNYINHHFEEIFKLEDDKFIMGIKYFYEPSSQKEYLFINMINMIHIFYIKNEKEFDLIYNQEFDKEVKKSNYEIIYNKFDQKSYLIISKLTTGMYPIPINDLYIYEFKDNQLILLNSFLYNMGIYKNLLLFHEDNNTKNIYLFLIIEGIYKYMPINKKEEFMAAKFVSNFFESETENPNKQYQVFASIEEKKNFKFFEYGCVVYRNNNDDLLYLSDKLGNINILNLNKKKLVKELSLNINSEIQSFLNYNNKNIIVGIKNALLIFDIKNNQIINKYRIDFGEKEYLLSIKKFISNDKKFCSLFVDGTDKKIRILS